MSITAPALLNSIGLFAGFMGALIFAKFALPAIDVFNDGAYVASEDTPRARKNAKRARWGLWLIAVGFVLQLAAVWFERADARPITAATIGVSDTAWRVIVGLGVTIGLGFVVGPLVKLVGDSIELPPPSKDAAIVESWKQLVSQTTGGRWIGLLERPIFFAACWFQAWLLITGWLVFKLAFYWQGANFTAFPRTPPDAEQLRWVATKRQLGTHHVATALVGTAANIVVAMIGVAIGKWVTWASVAG